MPFMISIYLLPDCARSRGPKVPCQSGESIPETAFFLVLAAPDGVGVLFTLVGERTGPAFSRLETDAHGTDIFGMQENHFCGRAYIRFLHNKSLCLKVNYFTSTFLPLMI